MSNDRVLVLDGPRGVGKTTLMQQLQDEMSMEGKQTTYINIRKERFFTSFDHADDLIARLKKKYVCTPENRLYVFLDELSYLTHPYQFLFRAHDVAAGSMKFVAASSAHVRDVDVDSRLFESMSIFTLYPLSWQEYLATIGTPVPTRLFGRHDFSELQQFYHDHRPLLEEQLKTFIHWGGYPRTIMAKTNELKEDVITDMIHNYIEKDVNPLLKPKNVSAYVDTVQYLCSQIGEFFNHNHVSALLGLHKKTLQKFVDISRDTFLLTYVKPFFTDPRTEASKMTRVYGFDTGMTSHFLGNVYHYAGSRAEKDGEYTDVPHYFQPYAMKNFILSELKKSLSFDDVYYYRTIAKAGVTFVATCKDKIIPIQVPTKTVHEKKVSVATKNFVKKYHKRALKPFVITSHELRFDADCYYVPAALFPFLDFTSFMQSP